MFLALLFTNLVNKLIPNFPFNFLSWHCFLFFLKMIPVVSPDPCIYFYSSVTVTQALPNGHNHAHSYKHLLFCCISNHILQFSQKQTKFLVSLESRSVISPVLISPSSRNKISFSDSGQFSNSDTVISLYKKNT